MCIAVLALYSTNTQAHYEVLVDTNSATTVPGDDCQSFALSIALAWHRDVAVDLDGIPQLRKMQDSIASAAMKQMRQRTPENDFDGRLLALSHQDFVPAINEVLQHNYSLQWKDLEPTRVLAEIAARTRVAFLTREREMPLGSGVSQPLLLSARRVDGQRFSTGQWVPVFGLRGAGDATELLTLQPGLRVGPSLGELSHDVVNQPVCGRGLDQLPTTWEYAVQVAWMPANRFEWNRYGTRVRVFWVEQGVSHGR